MGTKDSKAKEYLSDNTRFSEICNYVLFDGEKVIKPEDLKECEAFLEGHFLLSSGRHSGAYCQMAFLQQYPDKAAEVMAPVAEKPRS